MASPAFRFGAQQFDKLREVGGLGRSLTCEAAAAHTPINLPPRGHPVQMRDLFRFRAEGRPIATATADHADAYKRLLSKEEDELAAAATLLDPKGGLWNGFTSRKQLFWIRRSHFSPRLLAQGDSFFSLQVFEDSAHWLL